MKKVIILSVLLGFTFASQAQTFEDAVQFSRIQNWGTARSAGMAGAFGALGGDLSTLSANPAGIGVFRKSEISITPSLNFANTKATDYSPKELYSLFILPTSTGKASISVSIIPI